MPLRLAVKVKLQKRSERVKWIDVHSQEPWILTALYSGRLFIWNYETETLVKSFDVVEQTPVRSAKFVERNQWIVCGADDNHIRCYNYNTSELLKAFEAHSDYIRCVEVHPSLPYILSSSDDMSIKLWNWDKNWDLMQVFEGHIHYVMQVKFNPKDSNTFASASLDRTIKVWGIGSSTPHFTLTGHDKGVNCIDYYPGADKPYLLSGADDYKVKVWDYQTKACVATLESGASKGDGSDSGGGGGGAVGHTANVSAVAFHPKLPVIITASEDNTVRVWHSTTYRLESTLNYRLERAWTVGVSANSQKIAVGFDEGAIVLKLGKECPIVSMDSKSGKFIWVRNNEILTASVRGSGKTATDGESVRLSGEKDLGTCELYPQDCLHNNNGRFLAVCGDGEYIVYTAGVLRNKCFGTAVDFGWSTFGTGDYAIRDQDLQVKIFKSFKDTGISFRPSEVDAEQLWGGALIAVKSNDAVAFYDWDTGYYIQRIDVPAMPKAVYWNDAGDKVIIATREAFYQLKFNREIVEETLSNGRVEDGVDEAFILEAEIQEVVRSGQWVGDCFLYVSKSGRLNYSVGGQTMTLSHLDRKMYMLGYVGRENRVYLCDKQMNVTSYLLLTSILEYQTWVLRDNFEEANAILNSGAIPDSENNKISRFLESQGFREEALEVANDPEQRFSLALQLRKLNVAKDIMSEFSSSTESPSDIQFKWKQLGDLALMCGEMELSKNCAENAGDLSGLLLMHSAYGDRDAMAGLATTARKAGKFNVAFAASYILGDVHQCVDMLLHIGRVPEAALFARTYVPSRIGEVVRIWKKELSNISDVLSQALADPTEHPEGFPNLDIAMNAEQIYQQAFEQSKRCASASNYPAFVENRNSLMNENGEIDVLALLQKGNSLVSGPGFAGGSVGSSSGGAVYAKEDVKGEVKEDEVKEEEVKEEEVKLEDEDEVSEKDDDLLLDDEEEENEVQQKAPPAPAVEQKAPPAQEEAPPQEENDDDDLDDLLGDSNDDGLNGSGEDDDIDLDDLGLDDDDEWS